MKYQFEAKKVDNSYLILSFLVVFFFILNCSYILLYASLTGPMEGSPLIGYDEVNYLNRSVALYQEIINTDLMSTFSVFYNYTHSLHWGNYYFLAGLFVIFDEVNLKLVAVVKMFLYCFVSVPFFFLLVKEFFTKMVALYISISLLLFFPLIIFIYSLMRDDLIFLLVTVLLYITEKIFRSEKKLFLIILFFCFFYLLIGFRIHMAIAVAIYFLAKIMVDVDYYKLTVKRILLISVLVILFLGSIYLGVVQSLIGDVDLVVSFYMFPYTFAKLFFSPIPWQITEGNSVILTVWYSLSFPVVIFLGGLVVFKAKYFLNNFNRLLPFFGFICIFIFPYAYNDGLGYRQGAIVIPFLFFFIVFPCVLNFVLINKFKER